jgi:transcriptional regulator with XRE-family HTH domain
MNNIGKIIKRLRKAADLSQQELADKLGMQRVAITQIENSARDVCAEEIKNMAEIFQVSADTLLGLAAETEVILDKEGNKPMKRAETMRVSVPQKNVKKFKEVLLYILNMVGGRPNIGETALYKLLYFIDFNYYEKYEEQLIGATYIKNHYGPSPIEFKKITEQMINRNEIKKIQDKHFGYDQKKYLALRKPDLSVLSAREQKVIDEVLNTLADKNAKELSDYSHHDVPWLTAEDGKQISYESVFYRTTPYSVREYEDK